MRLIAAVHVVMVMAVTVLGARQFALADRPVAIGIELGKCRVCSRGVGAGTSGGALEFRLGDRPIAIAIERGEQLRRRLRDCRVGPGNFTLSLSQIPDVILSHHPARAID